MDFQDDGASAGSQYSQFNLMKSLYDKLIILGYRSEFSKLVRIKPIHQFYFAVPKNPGEQYFNFVSIAAWLIQKCKRNISMPQESDDPNMVTISILDHCKNMGGQIDFAPNRVKSGSGAEVVYVLNFLADQALKATGHSWKELVWIPRKKLPGEADDDAEDLPDDEVNEIDSSKIDEEIENLVSSDDDDNDVAWVQGDALGGQDAIQQKMIKSETDAEEWRLEVERVLPQLKITVKSDGQDWRWRQEQMKNYVEGIKDAIDQMEKPLERLVTEAKNVSEKVISRENFLNTQFSRQLEDLHESQKKLSQLKEVHRELSNKVAEKNKTLTHLSDELDGTRRELEERGTIMADGAPVVKTRKALAALKKELGDMEVEIGVMEHCLLKAMLQEQMVLRDQSKV